jgi:hypothetical protein
MQRRSLFHALTILFIAPGIAWPSASVNGIQDTLGPRFGAATQSTDPPNRHPAPSGTNAVKRLLYWNEQALKADARDHAVASGEIHPFGEQLGPARSSRALAIVHLAIFDAVNAVTGSAATYTGLARAHPDTSVDAAIAQAAHDTLVSLYPSQARIFNMHLASDLLRIADGRAKLNGVDLGRRAAAAILELRANDGSEYPEPRIGIDFFPSNAPGKWRPDPISQSPIALGGHWGKVTPFVLKSTLRFQPPAPPALTSATYTLAFREVKWLGGDGKTTRTKRTLDQTIAGIYWAYDGTGVGTPPRLYNQIAVEIAEKNGANVSDLARLLALANVAMADSCMVVWEAKYRYQFWRPVTGIREADEGTGPTGLGDGNPDTHGDPNFTPLGSPASNLRVPNFTPPFPAYPSGHAGLGSALFEILRNFYGTDQIPFTFVSDEFNGVTRDNKGRVRPRLPRSFATLSEAEEENGQSRIYLGVHWAFDKIVGITVGRRVADYVFRHGLVQPVNQLQEP